MNSTKVQNPRRICVNYAHAYALCIETPPLSVKYTENSEEYIGFAIAGPRSICWCLKQRWTCCLSIVKLLMPPWCVTEQKVVEVSRC